jgi:hypothetical protein
MSGMERAMTGSLFVPFDSLRKRHLLTLPNKPQ